MKGGDAIDERGEQQAGGANERFEQAGFGRGFHGGGHYRQPCAPKTQKQERARLRRALTGNAANGEFVGKNRGGRWSAIFADAGTIELTGGGGRHHAEFAVGETA